MCPLCGKIPLDSKEFRKIENIVLILNSNIYLELLCMFLHTLVILSIIFFTVICMRGMRIITFGTLLHHLNNHHNYVSPTHTLFRKNQIFKTATKRWEKRNGRIALRTNLNRCDWPCERIHDVPLRWHHFSDDRYSIDMSFSSWERSSLVPFISTVGKWGGREVDRPMYRSLQRARSDVCFLCIACNNKISIIISI